MGFISIAVDGPAGAGKSTLARQLAEKLGYLYVDTGAIYRTLGLFARESGVDPADSSSVATLLKRADIQLKHGADGLQCMFLNDKDVTAAIRLPEISRYASFVSAHPAVRAFLLEMQRDMARRHNVVMDGRDIGTVVLPDAAAKIFLTASAEERACRRCQDLEARGIPQAYDTVLAEIIARDQMDTTRESAPLRQAEDAILVDTTGQTPGESLETLLATVRRILAP